MKIMSFTGKETAAQEKKCFVVSISVPQLRIGLKQSLNL